MRLSTLHSVMQRAPYGQVLLPLSLRTMSLRRTFSSPNLPHSQPHENTHKHAPLAATHRDQPEPTPHSHKHSIFGHSHSHDDLHLREDAEKIMEALKGSGSRGSRITLIGLGSNVVLTSAKGLAGCYMHSASLLADAGHSMSDLLGDLVTLVCWNLSRKSPTSAYPYGFAKFETIGTTTISLLLIGGALGIGFHSYSLLIAALGETASTLPGGVLRDIVQNITSVSTTLPQIGHGHTHSVDPNAAWFAAISVVVKEYLYRITKKVADEETSPVLLANALHHRSDAYSSLVAFCAILGTWAFPSFPLDPIGGLLVSIVILRQGVQLLVGAWEDLTDAGVSPNTRRKLQQTLDPLIFDPELSSEQENNSFVPLLAVQDLRARRAGSLIFVDLIAVVPPDTNVVQTAHLERVIVARMKVARKEVAEVQVRFQTADFSEPSPRT